MGLLVRVKDWTSGASEGATREAEVLANGLSDDISTCVQDAGSYCGVHIWYKALEHGGPIHHGNSRQADVVLEGDGDAGEGAGSAGGTAFIRGAGGCQRLFPGDADKAVESAVQGRDPVQEAAGQLGAGKLSGLQPGG